MQSMLFVVCPLKDGSSIIKHFSIINLQWIERWLCRTTVNRGDGGSIPPTAVLKLRQFRLPHICLCLLEDTLKAGGPVYLGGKCVTF